MPTPLIFANALAADNNIRSVLSAIQTTRPPPNRTRPRRTSIISLTDSEGEDHRIGQREQQPIPPPPNPIQPASPKPRVFVIEGTAESDEEYQEYLSTTALRRAARENKKATRRGRSAERHRQIAEERERSAELHARLARRAGKLPEERNYTQIAQERGPSASEERNNTQIAQERKRSAKLHPQLSRRAEKLTAERNTSSGSYTDADFDRMVANLTIDDDGSKHPLS